MRIFHVDAFTDRPFGGNPAAVCLLDDGTAVEDQWMQSVAAEMNLSETAFLERQSDGFGLRWFTPTVEVDLCGHATLASAHVLWELGEQSDQLAFHTRSGVLTAERAESADGGQSIRLDFPAEPASEVDAPSGLLEALGVTARWVGRNRLGYLIEVADAGTVREVAPEYTALRQFAVPGVMVTAPSDVEGVDFVSRFFGPAVGIDEDPVTGAAHCCLGPFWAARLGRNPLVGYQASARGGTVGVEVAGDRVYLYGQAVTVLRGELSAR